MSVGQVFLRQFSLSCFNCDAGQGITNEYEATDKGWHGIEEDDGLSWNYLGWCPQCVPIAVSGGYIALESGVNRP